MSCCEILACASVGKEVNGNIDTKRYRSLLPLDFGISVVDKCVFSRKIDSAKE